uniref:Uncharacterized protein n=1 Tax=Mola mola TaxID=94237 RepID=A0A3Q3WB76_MOLML
CKRKTKKCAPSLLFPSEGGNAAAEQRAAFSHTPRYPRSCYTFTAFKSLPNIVTIISTDPAPIIVGKHILLQKIFFFFFFFCIMLNVFECLME